MWEVRVSLFRAVTPVSICLASLSKVTCIVLFGLQRLTIDWTKRGGVGGEEDEEEEGERKQIMCSKCPGEDKEGLLTWLRVDVPGRKWITAFLTPHWPRHLNLTSSPLPKKPQWSYGAECLMWYEVIFEQKVNGGTLLLLLLLGLRRWSTPLEESIKKKFFTVINYCEWLGDSAGSTAVVASRLARHREMRPRHLYAQ